MDRRQFIAASSALGAMTVAGRAFAAPQAGGTKLLIVFLRGAYDAANIVAPVGNDFYHQARPTIALGKPNPADPNAPLPLDGDWALHPALKDTIYPLWQKREIAFIPFAGTDDMSRSHFETQDTIELGQPIAGSRNYGSGFMARLAARLGAPRAIAFTDQVPLCFRGGPMIPNFGLNGIGKPGIDNYQAGLIDAMYKGVTLGGTDLGYSVSEGFAVRDTVYKAISAETTAEMAGAGRGAVSAKGFELSARRVGRLMRDQYDLAFLDVGGWDTHVNQGGAQGYLAGRIGELGRGLAGFIDEIGDDHWRSTTVIVVSEFGRTFHENGNKGTDHGHGSVYWVLGGTLRGGRMVGPQVAISSATLNQNRDLPVLTDYRALIGGIVQPLYGLRQDALGNVFPQTTPARLELV